MTARKPSAEVESATQEHLLTLIQNSLPRTSYEMYELPSSFPIKRPLPLITVDRHADQETQKRFYTALLTLPWLTSKIRNPVMAELGLNPRQQKEGIALAETLMMQAQVDAGKRDGRRASVVKTLADERKDEVAALHQRLYRARKRLRPAKSGR